MLNRFICWSIWACGSFLFLCFPFFFLNLCRHRSWWGFLKGGGAVIWGTGIYAHTPSLIRFGSQRFFIKKPSAYNKFWPFFVIWWFFSLCACWADFAPAFYRLHYGSDRCMYLFCAARRQNIILTLFIAPLRCACAPFDTRCEYWFMHRFFVYLRSQNWKFKIRIGCCLTISAHLISLAPAAFDIRWIHKSDTTT